MRTLVLLLGLLPVVSTANAAQAPAPLRIAVVSSQRISAESAPGKAAVAKVQALQQQRNADLRTRQQAIEALRQRIAQAPDAGALAPLLREEQQQRAEFERSAAQAQVDVQALQRQLNADLGRVVRTVLEELAKARGVDVVLNLETAVVWVGPSLDLTNAVIERLNAPAAQ
ncbi:MAG: OmpH family outer membrane protein [Acidobacteria bacterium]|nr:OmpH family outer membrane protein [Acidobacteriota bacterium]